MWPLNICRDTCNHRSTQRMKNGLSVLIIHQRPGAGAHASACPESEYGVLAQVKAVAEALVRCSLPHRSLAVNGLPELCENLAVAPEPVVFNLLEALPRGQDVNAVPALCRAFGKGVTGADSACLALTQNKWRTNALLRGLDVQVPDSLLVLPGKTPEEGALPAPPYIVKPNGTDASEGIEAGSSVHNSFGAPLLKAIRSIHSRFGQGALVETMVGSRELNISLFRDGEEIRTMPLAEIDFSAFSEGMPRVVDYDAKWKPGSFACENTPRLLPAPLSADLARRIRNVARRAYQACGCTCYARVDMRLDERQGPYVLEINPNPDLSPDAGFVAALHAGGWTFDAFVRTVVSNALSQRRNREKEPEPSAYEKQSPEDRRLEVRPTLDRDRDAILHFMDATGFFRADEMEIAREVLDDSLAKRVASGYRSLTGARDGKPVGWICFGPTACTLGTYDVYWLGVDPAAQGGGVGRRLLAEAESAIRGEGGRLVIVETAGRGQYLPTRRFYMRNGYTAQPPIPDFYAVGDDKVIFTKQLS